MTSANRVNYFEDHYCFYTDELGSILPHLGDISVRLSETYRYRPTEKTLWAELFIGNNRKRVMYIPESDSLQAVTQITTKEFYDYCVSLGIPDAACEDKGDHFTCFSLKASVNSFTINSFSEWSDALNLRGEYQGYLFKLYKLDLYKFTFFNPYI